MIAILALAAQFGLFGPAAPPPDPNAKVWIDVSTGSGPNHVFLDTASIISDGSARKANVVITGPGTFSEGTVEVNCATNQYRYAGAKSWANDDPKNSRRICNRDFASLRLLSRRDVLGPDRTWFEMRGPEEVHLFVNGASIKGEGDSRTAEIILVTLKGLTPIKMEFRCQGTFNGYRRGKVFVKAEAFAGPVCNNNFRGARVLTKTEIETVVGPADLAPTWVYVPGDQFGATLVDTASLRSSGTIRVINRWTLHQGGGRSFDSVRFDCAAKPRGREVKSAAELIRSGCQGTWPSAPRYSAVALLGSGARQKILIDHATDAAGTYTHGASGAAFPMKIASFTRHRIDWDDNRSEHVSVIYKHPTVKGDAYVSVSIGPLSTDREGRVVDTCKETSGKDLEYFMEFRRTAQGNPKLEGQRAVKRRVGTRDYVGSSLTVAYNMIGAGGKQGERIREHIESYCDIPGRRAVKFSLSSPVDTDVRPAYAAFFNQAPWPR